MPCIPALVSASFTSSSLNGFTIASTIFIEAPSLLTLKKNVELLVLRCLEQALCHDYLLVRSERIRLETVRDFSDHKRNLNRSAVGLNCLAIRPWNRKY